MFPPLPVRFPLRILDQVSILIEDKLLFDRIKTELDAMAVFVGDVFRLIVDYRFDH